MGTKLEVNAAAAALGARGGRARARNLTAEELSAIGRKGQQASLRSRRRAMRERARSARAVARAVAKAKGLVVEKTGGRRRSQAAGD